MTQSLQPVAVVTGAGSGIGRAVALLLAQGGHDVVLAGRTQAPLEEVAGAIETATSGASRSLVIPTDIGRSEEVERLIRTTDQEMGRLDVLINNAGRADLLPIERTDPEIIRHSFEVNAIGPALAIHLAWPIFKRRKSGCIVNVSTAGTHDPFPGFFAYAASKASVNLMAKSAANEGKSIGVRAFSVAPGAVETPMLRGIFNTKTVPTQACLTPEQVGNVILDCVTGRRDGDNGKTILIRRDGDKVVELVF